MYHLYLNTVLKYLIYIDRFITKRNKCYISISDGTERYILEP